MVYALLSWQFWSYWLVFLVAAFVSFYIPGSQLISRYKVRSAYQHLLLSFVLGLVLWGTQGYLFGYLHIRFLTYIYLAIFAVLFISRRAEEKKIWQNLVKELQHGSKLVIAAISLGTIWQCLAVMGSGLRYGQGVEFFFPNAVDGILHLSFIQSIVAQFPPHEPGAFDLALVNYHYWSDLVAAELVRVWHLPVAHLFFQYMPPLIACATAVAVYAVVRQLGGSKKTGLWALFFLFVGGDAAYLFTLLFSHVLNFHTPAIDNGAAQFLNMPHVYAKMIFFTGLLPLTLWFQKKQKRWLFLSIFLFATLFGFKIYFGLFAVAGLGVAFFVQTLRIFFSSTQKSLNLKLSHTLSAILPLLISVVVFASLAAVIYLPTNKSAGGLFYAPLEWPKLFLNVENLNWQTWWLRHQQYDSTHNVRNLMVLDMLAIIICLVSVYGTRLLGLWPFARLPKTFPLEMKAFLFLPSMVFIFLGLYTLQTSGLFNVFNFFAVSALTLSLFSAFTLDALASSRSYILRVAAVIIVLLTLPRALFEGGNYLERYAHNKYDNVFSNEEVELLWFVRTHTQPGSIVQSHWDNENDRYTPYVAFFSNRLTYLSGERMLETHNQPIDQKRIQLKYIFDAPNSDELGTRARESGINYLYLSKKNGQLQDIKYTINPAKMEILFENEKGMILHPKETSL